MLELLVEFLTSPHQSDLLLHPLTRGLGVFRLYTHLRGGLPVDLLGLCRIGLRGVVPILPLPVTPKRIIKCFMGLLLNNVVNLRLLLLVKGLCIHLLLLFFYNGDLVVGLHKLIHVEYEGITNPIVDLLPLECAVVQLKSIELNGEDVSEPSESQPLECLHLLVAPFTEVEVPTHQLLWFEVVLDGLLNGVVVDPIELALHRQTQVHELILSYALPTTLEALHVGL